jgi:acylglycerol lipase
LIELDEEPELNEQGDKYYKIDSEALLFDQVEGFHEGTLEIQDVVIKREYIDTEGEMIKISHTEICHKTESPKATIAMFHGFGQYSDMFLEIGIQFAMNGYKVQLIDFRGYGWSGGRRLEYTLVEMQNDIVALLKEADPELPMFFYCHSMGGMVTLSFLMNNPSLSVSGVICSAPVTGKTPNLHIDSFRLSLVKMLGQNLPELIVNPRLNTSSISKKAIVLKWLLTNKKVVPMMGSRQAHIVAYYMHHFYYNASSFKHPILVHLGSEDKVVNNDATKKFMQNGRS